MDCGRLSGRDGYQGRFDRGQHGLVERLAQLATLDLRQTFFDDTLRQDLAVFGRDRDAERISRLTYDTSMLNVALINLFGLAVREPIKMVTCLIGTCLISWQLLVFSLLVAPPAFVLMRVLARLIKRANTRAMEEMTQLYNSFSESLRGIQTVKAFTMEEHERERFRHSTQAFYEKAMQIAWYNSLAKPVTELLGIGVISVALAAGAYLVLRQETHIFGIRMCQQPLEIGVLLLFYALLAGVSARPESFRVWRR